MGFYLNKVVIRKKNYLIENELIQLYFI